MDKKKIDTFVHRITQLDAYQLDRELHSVLKNSISEINNYLEPGYLNNVMPEIELLLKTIMFKYFVLENNSTFGQQFLNLKFDAKLHGKKAVWFFLLNYFIPYVKLKYDIMSLSWNNNKVKKLMDKLELFIKVCQYLNMLIFLRKGVYPTLADRLLGMKMVPIVSGPRNVGYNFMTRELIWHCFMEFFMYFLPLINYGYVKKKILDIISFKTNQLIIPKKISYNEKTVCNICGEKPIYPCKLSEYCEHIACYYCIKSNIMEDKEYICSSCGAQCTAHANMEFINFG